MHWRKDKVTRNALSFQPECFRSIMDSQLKAPPFPTYRATTTLPKHPLKHCPPDVPRHINDHPIGFHSIHTNNVSTLSSTSKMHSIYNLCYGVCVISLSYSTNTLICKSNLSTWEMCIKTFHAWRFLSAYLRNDIYRLIIQNYCLDDLTKLNSYQKGKTSKLHGVV